MTPPSRSSSEAEFRRNELAEFRGSPDKLTWWLLGLFAASLIGAGGAIASHVSESAKIHSVLSERTTAAEVKLESNETVHRQSQVELNRRLDRLETKLDLALERGRARKNN